MSLSPMQRIAVVDALDGDLRRALAVRLGDDGLRMAGEPEPQGGATHLLVVDVPVPAPLSFVGDDPVRWYAEVHAALSRPFRAVRGALPSLREAQDARVVILGAGWLATEQPRGTAAGAAHGGVVALTKTLARDLGPDGIRVNHVVVDPTEPVSPEHVAEAVSYLAEPRAAAVTGQLVTLGRGGHVRP
jgi:NAD(P)-dependent dehydrogenase (short-subunit alcohol dehydrogenase family)